MYFNDGADPWNIEENHIRVSQTVQIVNNIFELIQIIKYMAKYQGKMFWKARLYSDKLSSQILLSHMIKYTFKHYDQKSQTVYIMEDSLKHRIYSNDLGYFGFPLIVSH